MAYTNDPRLALKCCPSTKSADPRPHKAGIKPRFLSLCFRRAHSRLRLGPPQKWDFVVSPTDVREARADNALILTLVVGMRKRKKKKNRPGNFRDVSWSKIHTELHRLNCSCTQLSAGELKAVSKKVKTLSAEITFTVFYIIPLFYSCNLEGVKRWSLFSSRQMTGCLP